MFVLCGKNHSLLPFRRMTRVLADCVNDNDKGFVKVQLCTAIVVRSVQLPNAVGYACRISTDKFSFHLCTLRFRIIGNSVYSLIQTTPNILVIIKPQRLRHVWKELTELCIGRR